MCIYNFLIIISFLFSGTVQHPQKTGTKPFKPQTIIFNFEDLCYIKKEINPGNPDYIRAYQNLINRAEGLLDVEPYSVVHKTKIPASGDIHDYYSIGTYWWPDTTKEDGLPYIRRDGITNPEVVSDATDKSRRGKTVNAIETLCLASYYSENEIYAKKAADFIKTWFINPDTRMNPNINHGQALPGINTGRDIGVIDFSILPECLDHIELIKGSKYWSKKDQKKLNKWLAEFLNWYLTSRIALAESRKPNNHGSYYDYQVAYMSLYLGEEQTTLGILEGAKRRIDWQILIDGRQPEELIRTRSFEYSIVNLNALARLAVIGEKAGVDLWGYQSEQNSNLTKALDFVVGHMDKMGQWPGQQIVEVNYTAKLWPLLVLAHKTFPGKGYDKVIANFPKQEVISHPYFLKLAYR